MKDTDQRLLTPIHLKVKPQTPWPEQESAFYLVTRDGLFRCRNHALFQSCVRSDTWPTELAGQKPFLRLNTPRIPRHLIEQVIGFFDLIGQRHKSEAAVLLVWNRNRKAVEVMVPEQTGIVGTGYGTAYPIELAYTVPQLPPHLLLIGDIHSHVDYAAYASQTDQRDEHHRPGLHLVVGRLYLEPPEFHCEFIVDGTRFKIGDLTMVLEGYRERRPDKVPPAWINQVSIETWSRWIRHQPPSTNVHASVGHNRARSELEIEISSASKLPGNGDGNEIPGSPSGETGTKGQ